MAMPMAMMIMMILMAFNMMMSMKMAMFMVVIFVMVMIVRVRVHSLLPSSFMIPVAGDSICSLHRDNGNRIAALPAVGLNPPEHMRHHRCRCQEDRTFPDECPQDSFVYHSIREIEFYRFMLGNDSSPGFPLPRT